VLILAPIDRTTLAYAGKDSSVKLWSLNAANVETGELDKLLVIDCRWLEDYTQNNLYYVSSESQI
jgi:hypothetical protein